ncbi:putative 3-ketoacyl-CoA reductase [Seiridium unicorne]|uniref:3-ketoacyl-CoA reductase n=1 Tax=Seiridium unicorne TaxID=138068 RepID=A0ABR2V2S9_9PEZI
MAWQELSTNIIQFVGTIALAYTCYWLLWHILFYLLPNLSLDRWRHHQQKSWALVAGSSAGISLGAAQELAIKGFNVVLLGHLRDELAEARSLILAESPRTEVEIVVLDATSASSKETEQALRPLSSLPLTVLVNNVGGFPIKPPQIRNLVDYTGEELDRSLNINAHFLSQVTRILLPQICIVPYSGCKGIIVSFSKALSKEMRAARLLVDVLAIVPGNLQSRSHVVGLMPGTPTARAYAKIVLDRAPRAVSWGRVEVIPFWPHAVQILFVESLSR